MKDHFLQIVYVIKVWSCLCNSEIKVDNQYLPKHFQSTLLDKELIILSFWSTQKPNKKDTNNECSFLNEISQGQVRLVIYPKIWSH